MVGYCRSCALNAFRCVNAHFVSDEFGPTHIIQASTHLKGVAAQIFEVRRKAIPCVQVNHSYSLRTI